MAIHTILAFDRDFITRSNLTIHNLKFHSKKVDSNKWTTLLLLIPQKQEKICLNS